MITPNVEYFIANTHTYTPSAMQLPSSTRRVLSAIFAVCKQVFRLIARFRGFSLIRFVALFDRFFTAVVCIMDTRVHFLLADRTQRLLLHESIRHIFA
jgi:hypothetical protein